jgi:hypothetical protein
VLLYVRSALELRIVDPVGEERRCIGMEMQLQDGRSGLVRTDVDDDADHPAIVRDIDRAVNFGATSPGAGERRIDVLRGSNAAGKSRRRSRTPPNVVEFAPGMVPLSACTT